MAAFAQQENTRCNKRPRHGDYNLGDLVNGDGSSAFETPRTSINPLSLPAPGHFDDARSLVHQDYHNQSDFLFTWVMEENNDFVPVPGPYDDFMFLPSLVPANDTVHYTHEQPATYSATGDSSIDGSMTEQGGWVLPGAGTECVNVSSSTPSFLPPPSGNLIKASAGPSEQEWEEQKPFIAFLYGPDESGLNLTLPEVKRIMEKMGCLTGATENMYKNRFHKWGIIKNESNALRRRRAGRPQQQARVRLGSSLSSSPSSEARITAKDMFENMRALCVENIQQKQPNIWALDDEFCVIDDDWEDGYGAAAALIFELVENVDSPSGWETIRDDITPIVRTLNYFSLPTILIIAFKMCKRLVDPKTRRTVGDFISGCLQIARAESLTQSRHVPLVNILQGLSFVAQQHDETDDLAGMLQLIIPCYIQLVNNHGNSETATALSLLSFYHVQLESDELWLKCTYEKLIRLLKRAEAAKGKHDKATIEIMGLAVMVLQKTKLVKELRQLTSQIRLRSSFRLERMPRGHPDRMYFVDRLLDGYHLDIRLAQQDGEDEYAAELKMAYERLEVSYEKEKDSYGKILDLEVKNLTSELEGTSL